MSHTSVFSARCRHDGPFPGCVVRLPCEREQSNRWNAERHPPAQNLRAPRASPSEPGLDPLPLPGLVRFTLSREFRVDAGMDHDRRGSSVTVVPRHFEPHLPP